MDKITLNKRFAVYVDSTVEDIPRVFYVGKGTTWRCNDRRSRNKAYQLIRKEFGMQRVIVFETDDETEAYAKEREVVTLHDTFLGWGANGDQGGVGGPGTPKSDEHKKRIRQALTGKTKSTSHRTALSHAHKGKILSNEHKERIRNSVRDSITSEGIESRRRGAITANKVRWDAYRLKRSQQSSLAKP